METLPYSELQPKSPLAHAFVLRATFLLLPHPHSCISHPGPPGLGFICLCPPNCLDESLKPSGSLTNVFWMNDWSIYGPIPIPRVSPGEIKLMTKKCLQTWGEGGGEGGTEMPGAGGVRVGRSESRLDGPQSRQDAPVCLLGWSQHHSHTLTWGLFTFSSFSINVLCPFKIEMIIPYWLLQAVHM